MIDIISQLTTAQRVGYGFVLLCLFIVLFEVGGLLYLRSQVGRYDRFWQQKATESGEIVYIALGDSAAQGIGATSPMRGYVGLITQKLEAETGKSVRVINLSKTGAKIDDVLQRQIPSLSDYPEADIITLEIGANDVKTFMPEEFRRSFSEVLEQLPENTYVSDLPDFGAGPLLEPQNEASSIAARLIKEQTQLNFVALEQETEEHFRHWIDHSFDFFHPDNNGYKIWFNAFWQQIEDSPLVDKQQ